MFMVQLIVLVVVNWAFESSLSTSHSPVTIKSVVELDDTLYQPRT